MALRGWEVPRYRAGPALHHRGASLRLDHSMMSSPPILEGELTGKGAALSQSIQNISLQYKGRRED